MEWEWFFLVNLLMNAVALTAMARIVGRMRMGRIALAAVVGALYALLSALPLFALIGGFVPMILVTFAMAVLCVDARTAKEGAWAGLVLIVVSGMVAGLTDFLNRWISVVPLCLLVASVSVLTLVRGYLTARDKRQDLWEAALDIRTCHGHTRLKALIDTGNRLHEPVSALPVVILGKEEALPLLPPGFDLEGAMVRLPPGFRLVGYGALGGKGQMVCFRPDALWVSYGKEWLRAPDVWVAVYPGALPGIHKAIAPPVIGRIGGARREMA